MRPQRALQHGPQRRPRAEKRRDQIRLKHLLEVFELHLHDEAIIGGTRVVDQNRHRAQASFSLLEKPLHIFLVRDIRL